MDHFKGCRPLTIGEIAGRLGVTREAAKSRLRRARALVREYLLGTKDSGREST
jgi:DNA-directed RNA polymerase specialized sigma24 family protein